MKHSIEVVLMPTEEISQVWKNPTHNTLWLVTDYTVREAKRNNELDCFQHLYITVSQDIESIKENDWCICFIEKKNQLRQVRNLSGHSIITTISTSINILDCSKIIATTDKTLKFWTDNEYGKHIWSLPQLSESFLKEYCNNPNQEWEIEYNDIFTSNQGLGYNETITCRIKSIKGDDVFGEYIEGCESNLEIPFSLETLKQEGNKFNSKLNQNNTVNITAVKEKMYSKAQLIENLRAYREFVWKNGATIQDLNKWVTKNI